MAKIYNLSDYINNKKIDEHHFEKKNVLNTDILFMDNKQNKTYCKYKSSQKDIIIETDTDVIDTIKEEMNNINILEKRINNSNKEYIMQLFIQYLNYIDGNINKLADDIINNNLYEYSSLVKLFPEFADYVNLCDNLKEYYLYHLIDEKIDINSEKAFEINKGELDTAATNKTTIISKYANSMNLTNAIIFKDNDKVYTINENGEACVLPEGSTIIIHNPYNLKDVIYTLEVLAGTDNRVVLGTWGFKEFEKNHLTLLNNYLKIIHILSDNDTKNIDLKASKNFEYDGIQCNSISVNTKHLKEVIPTTDLLTNKEKEIIKKVSNSKIKKL